ncbi:MAG TPA: VWA domain-containing protein [Pyrinomonadaceae bacterium]|nr:VWA domain-containing protein [Pyrinomonadaceae bacterium]
MKRRLALILALTLLASNALAHVPSTLPQQTTQQPSTQTNPTQTSAQATPTPTSTQATPTPQSTPAEESEEDVVRITTNLVQFDAVVTDRQGHQVTDLRPEDFEVFLDGKKQELTNFSYISEESGVLMAATPTTPRLADRNAPPIPPAHLRPEQVRRTVALVVDDLGTSFQSLTYVRQALKKFVDEQMQPGDLVAIMRTSAGMGALQQFTSDKNILYRAIEHVRWNPSGRSGISAFAPAAPDAFAQAKQQSGLSNNNANGNDPSSDLDEFREELFSVGTLGALNFIVRGMNELPGRKSVVMFSDGFKIYDQEDPTKKARVIDNLRRLIDLANRASVVVYTVDARGLQVAGLSAADDLNGRTTQQINDLLTSRLDELIDTQQGLQYLADATGGFLVKNNNDMSGAVRRVLEDQKGYYLIGFRPDESVFDSIRGRRHFNNLQVKVRRPGLRVRSRAGFIGVTDSEAKPVRRTRVEQLIGALASPFSSGDVPLRLTSLPGGDTARGSYVTSLMHIDMGGVRFTDEADGWHKAVLDVVALTFGEEGNVIDRIDRTETVRVRAAAYDAVRHNGLVYTMQVPVKKAGAYQLRVAVRDAATEKLGSASQFVEVPNLKKDRLALSGIIMQSSGFTAVQLLSSGIGAEGEQATPDPQGSPAVRRFRQGDDVDYYFNIYNARLDSAGRTQLQTQMRLFRDGQQVYAGQPIPFDPGKQTDTKNLHDGSRIHLNTGLAPGDYVLQIIVTDALAPEKRRAATQWIDFEIVK